MIVPSVYINSADSIVLVTAKRRGEYLGQLQEFLESLLLVPFFDGDMNKTGMHAVLVVRDGTWVYKVCRSDELPWLCEQVNFHNRFFGDQTAYSFHGIVEIKGAPQLVLRQPYVVMKQGSGHEARTQLLNWLREQFGAAQINEEESEIHSGGWMFDDLKDANIAINIDTGRFVVVDCIIHPLNTMHADLHWEVDKEWWRKHPEQLDRAAEC